MHPYSETMQLTPNHIQVVYNLSPLVTKQYCFLPLGNARVLLNLDSQFLYEATKGPAIDTLKRTSETQKTTKAIKLDLIQIPPWKHLI